MTALDEILDTSTFTGRRKEKNQIKALFINKIAELTNKTEPSDAIFELIEWTEGL